MIKKFILGFTALFFILSGSLILMMGYVLNKPEAVFDAFQSVTQKFFHSEKYVEKAEFFLQSIREVSISTQNADIVLSIHSQPTLLLELSGEVPPFEKGPFIIQSAQQSQLIVNVQEPLPSQWVQMNVNGQEVTQESNVKLTVHIFVPEAYKDLLTLSTEHGNVSLQLPANLNYELDLQSLQGPVENHLPPHNPEEIINPETLGHIKVRTDDGMITVTGS
ncbi:MAG: hypothetical protein AAGB31_07805 [Bdellovibrio sp.]